MAGKRKAPNGIEIDMPDTTPLHTELLHKCVENGAISQSLLDSVKPPPLT
jgi:hypothetical protein